MNPFLAIRDPKPLGPGSYEMALPLIQGLALRPGMRVLEVGAGTGQVAAVVAREWQVSVVTLEPWEDLGAIATYAGEQGVANQVLALNSRAQEMPFSDHAFDAVFSIGSFEMIGEERPQALREMARVARPGAPIGIAEPMCKPVPVPDDIADFPQMERYQHYFRTLAWNCDLFQRFGLSVTDAYYFDEAHQWWIDNFRYHDGDRDLVLRDRGRWLSLGLVIGNKSS